MKTVAYLRVSKKTQNLDQQRLAILDYAQRHNITIDEFVLFEGSSRKELKQRGVSQLLERMEQEDVLLVSELSRLGRSLGQIIFLVDRMLKKQIRFVAIKEGIDLFGKQDLQMKVMVTMFGLFAEIERDLISERTKDWLPPEQKERLSADQRECWGSRNLMERNRKSGCFLRKGYPSQLLPKLCQSPVPLFVISLRRGN